MYKRLIEKLKALRIYAVISRLNIGAVMCSLFCFIGIHKKTLIWKSDYHSKYECSRCKSKFIHEHHLGGRRYRVS